MLTDKPPCINCITYAICKARLADYGQQSFQSHLQNKIKDVAYPQPWRESILIAYYVRLHEKCSLIKNYIEEQLKKKHSKDIYKHTYDEYIKVKSREVIIYQTMKEAFNIEQPKG